MYCSTPKYALSLSTKHFHLGFIFFKFDFFFCYNPILAVNVEYTSWATLFRISREGQAGQLLCVHLKHCHFSLKIHQNFLSKRSKTVTILNVIAEVPSTEGGSASSSCGASGLCCGQGACGSAVPETTRLLGGTGLGLISGKLGAHGSDSNTSRDKEVKKSIDF